MDPRVASDFQTAECSKQTNVQVYCSDLTLFLYLFRYRLGQEWVTIMLLYVQSNVH